MMRATKVIPNLYRDSVALMDLSERISKFPGITRATAVTATQVNIDLLRDAALLTEQMPARPNDILIIVEGADESEISAAMQNAESSLVEASAMPATGGAMSAIVPSSLQMALEDMPSANLALISTPGEYAAAEADKALRLGLNVMVFSANVAIEDEIDLKQMARERGLLLMGPDCGTAILNGIPLGFANVLRRGPVGVVASAGTGLQQVTCLIDRAGIGISQGLGCGGHDLSDDVGGSSMLQGLEMLAADASTEIIVLIAKHPSGKAVQRVLDAARNVGKPVVVNFLGVDTGRDANSNIRVADTLEGAARLAIGLSQGVRAPAVEADKCAGDTADLARHTAGLSARQKYVRGLFSGGTFCYEAQLLLAKSLRQVWSNVPVDPTNAISDVWKSKEHTVIDMGDDIFTRGRPHPMIDQRLRLQRLAQEARDPETAVILFDVVLGYGAHPNPAKEISDAIAAARGEPTGGQSPIFVASVCGTESDPQNLQLQESMLRAAGVLVAPSNAAAARIAAGLVMAQSRQAEH